MREWKWNEEESDRLHGLSILAQLVYLRVFRERMDFSTGIVGGLKGKNIIYYFVIAEAIEFNPCPGSNKKHWRPKTEETRSAIRELERAGLVVDLGSNRKTGLIKKLVFATAHKSVQNRNPTGTPPRGTTASNAVNPAGNSFDDAGLGDGNPAGKTGGTPPGKTGGTPVHPVSSNKENTPCGDFSQNEVFTEIDDSFSVNDEIEYFVRMKLFPDPPDIDLNRLLFIEHYQGHIEQQTNKLFVTSEKGKIKLFKKWLIKAKLIEQKNAKRYEEVSSERSGTNASKGSAYEQIMAANGEEPASREPIDGEWCSEDQC